MNADYTEADLRAALAKLPLSKGEVLFIHSNLGFFGKAASIQDRQSLCQMFFAALMQRLDSQGTIVVPTFTYSFPRRQIFDPAATPSGMGIFAEWVRLHPESFRSCDPSYSVAAIGEKAEELTANSPENSFSPSGFFGRFLEKKGVILNLNFDAGSTFLHFLERQLDVPYRFDKTFEGYIKKDGTSQLARNIIYVRYLSSDETVSDCTLFHALTCQAGLFRSSHLGRGQLGCIKAVDCYSFLAQVLPKRPWLLTRAETLGVIPVLVPESTFSAI